MSDSNFIARREAFRKLHKSGCFVIPNPWDPGSARYLQHLGFKALATTSAGFAFSRGLPDDGGVVSRDAMLGNIAEITAATDLPVNADFQSGYAHEAETVGGNVRLCISTGVAGLSNGDHTRDCGNPLFELRQPLYRLKAPRLARQSTGRGARPPA